MSIIGLSMAALPCCAEEDVEAGSAALRVDWPVYPRRAEHNTVAEVGIPTKPATHSNRKPATDSDLKPAGVSDLKSATERLLAARRLRELQRRDPALAEGGRGDERSERSKERAIVGQPNIVKVKRPTGRLRHLRYHRSAPELPDFESERCGVGGRARSTVSQLAAEPQIGVRNGGVDGEELGERQQRGQEAKVGQAEEFGVRIQEVAGGDGPSSKSAGRNPEPKVGPQMKPRGGWTCSIHRHPRSPRQRHHPALAAQ